MLRHEWKLWEIKRKFEPKRNGIIHSPPPPLSCVWRVKFFAILHCALRGGGGNPVAATWIYFNPVFNLIYLIIISGDMKTPRNNEDVQMITSKLMAAHFFSFLSFSFLIPPPLFSRIQEDAPQRNFNYEYFMRIIVHLCVFIIWLRIEEGRRGETGRRIEWIPRGDRNPTVIRRKSERVCITVCLETLSMKTN